jgi:hypothetical protein
VRIVHSASPIVLAGAPADRVPVHDSASTTRRAACSWRCWATACARR